MKFQIQNAPITKRIAAFLLDLILLVVVATGFMFVISAITDYNSQVDQFEAYYTQYASAYGLETLNISETEYHQLPKEQQDSYNAALKAMNEDPEVLRTYSMVISLSLLIPSLGIFFAYAATEFAVPLFLGNGQTVGKKVFSLGVMRRDGVKITPLMLFARTLLGKFTIETMLPILFIVMNGVFGLAGMLVAGLILLFDLILLLATGHRTVIHDAFAQSVVVDMPTQMIFNSPEELIEYQKRLAAEEAAQAEYR